MENGKIIPNWIASKLPNFLTSQFYETKFGKIHYLTGGQGKPILFLHGNPTWSFLWRKVISELDPLKFHIFAPDLLNLGFSDGLSNKNFSMENHAQALINFIEGLNLKNTTLVVQDWGGPLGLYAASKIQGRFSSLVILNTGIAAPKHPYKISKFHSFVNKKVIPDIMFKIFHFPLHDLHKVQSNKESIKGTIAKAYRYPIRKKRRWASALQFARMVPTGNQTPFVCIVSRCREVL